MVGIALQRAIETRQRLGRPSHFQQRHAAPAVEFGIVRRKAKALVVAHQRAFELPEHVKHQSKTGEAFGAGEVASQRRLNERQRPVWPSMPQIDQAKSVQGVKIVRLMREDFAVKPFGPPEIAFVESALPAAQQTRKTRRKTAGKSADRTAGNCSRKVCDSPFMCPADAFTPCSPTRVS